MLTALVVALTAGIAARLRGGSTHELADTTFRWTPLLVAGLVVQVVALYWGPDWLGSTGGLAVLLLSNLAVAAWLFLNRTLPGLAMAGIGMALNVLVISANGAMPVLERSADLAGVTQSLDEASLKHEPMDDDTVLPWLGDAIPVPPFREVLSVGDVVLALGLARLVDARMMARKKPRHRAAPSRSASD